MTIHRGDRKSDNPRLQCSCCAKWMRLHGVRVNPQTGEREQFYRFYGGCGYTDGGDHLAGKAGPDGCRDVCDDCCHKECKRLSDEHGASFKMPPYYGQAL